MKKKIIAVTAVALVMAMCGVLFSSCKKEAEVVPISATPLAKGRLENIITTMCTVASADITDVASSANAPIKEVLVQVGDVVTKGQTLARLDSTSLQSDLDLKLKTMANVQESYDAAVAAAQTTLDRAQADYNKIYDDQKLALDALNQAKDRLATEDANQAIAANDTNVKNAQSKMADAEANYNRMLAGETVNKADGTPYSVEEISAEITNARIDFANAKATAFPAAYATCYSRVQEAHYDIIKPLTDAYDAATRAANDASVNANRAITDARTALLTTQNNTSALDSAKRDVEEAKKTLDKCEIVAPASGTITATKAAINAVASAIDSLFTISGNKSFKASGLLNGFDSTRVTTGQLCEITTNATGDTVMNGSLTMVSPQATDSNGNFTVTANITSPDPELKSGMTGRLRIILERSDDCFYVATDSIGTDANGNSVIYVISDDALNASASSDVSSEATEIKVTTGLATDYYTEISGSGLEEGMNVLDVPLS